MKVGQEIGRVTVRRAVGDVRAALAAEAARIEAAKAASPDGVPFGPARGPLRLVRDWQAMPGGTRRLAGQHLEVADVFDRMCRAAVLRHERAGGEGAVALPFTWGQIAVARDYLTVTERHAAGGVKCVDLQASGHGDGGGFMDAHIALGRRLAGYHAAIGTGQAMVLRRIRPSVRGARAGITDRALVDAVCLGGQMLGEVLEAHGWCNDGKHREAARLALVAALDRMQGYRD